MNWYKLSQFAVGMSISPGQTWSLKNNMDDTVKIVDYADGVVVVKRQNGKIKKISDDMLRNYFRYSFGAKKKKWNKLDPQLLCCEYPENRRKDPYKKKRGKNYPPQP